MKKCYPLGQHGPRQTRFAQTFLLLCGLLFCCATPLSALDYYWVGGSGQWSEYTTHWAKIPNPTLPAHYHANVPTADDDVYFGDTNGGTAYTVNVDAGSTVPKCRNMDWTGVPAGTVWGGGGGRMDIYGSLTMNANLSMTFNNEIHFISNDATTKQIWSKTVHFSGQVYFEGADGGWQLADDFFANASLYHQGGLIESNGNKMTIGSRFEANTLSGANGQLHLGASELVMLNGEALLRYLPAQFDPGTSHIKLYGISGLSSGTSNTALPPIHFYDVSFYGNITQFTGGGFGGDHIDGTLTFHQSGVIYSYHNNIPTLNNVVFLGDGYIANAQNYRNLTFTAGKTYIIAQYYQTSTDQTILPGGTLTALGAGTCSQFITIKSWQYGTHFNFVNNSGSTQTVHCAILEDCHATGSDPLEVLDGVDLGNTNGWIFTAPNPGLDLYWVGGAGDWNDPCHWTTNPLSLVGDCGCIPNGGSNVHFTANSGFTVDPLDVEWISTPADASYIACRDMDWSTVTGNPVFHSVLNSINTSELYIYGSLKYSPNMVHDFLGATRFRGKDIHDLTSAGQMFKEIVYFEGVGEIRFQDAFNYSNGWPYYNDVYHLRGTVNTLGNSITLGVNNGWQGNKDLNNNFVDQGATLWLGVVGGNSSTVTFSGNAAFVAAYEPGKFHPVESHIKPEGPGTATVTAENRPHDFWNVSFINNYVGIFYGGILNKLTYDGTFGIVENSTPNRLIHEMEMKDDGEIRGNQTFDIITLTGGNGYTLQNGSVQTITSGGAFNTTSDCEHYVTLTSGLPDKTAEIKKEGGGSLTINNVVLNNITGDLSTGATYTALNGIALGTTTGWSVLNPPARTLYWVGGNGDWNSAAHWSLASGGAGGECPPTPLDNVFFNGASGLDAANVVTISQLHVHCKDMDWTGVGNGTKLTGISKYLNIYGNLTFSAGMNYEVHSTYFRAQQPVTITSAGKKYYYVYFWSPTGEWTLMDDFETVPDVDVYHYYGTLRSNNHNIGVGRIWWGAAPYYLVPDYTINPTAKLFLGSSKVKIYPSSVWAAQFGASYSANNFAAGTSEIIFESGVYSTLYGSDGTAFYDVTFKEKDARLTGECEILGKALFEKDGSISSSASATGPKIHFVEFLDDAYFYGSRPYHIMKFAPGKRYTFTRGFTQTLVPHLGVEGQFIAQGLPGQYIEMKSSNPSVPATIHMDDLNGTSTCTKYLFLTGMTHTGTEDIYVPTPGGNVFNNSGWQFFPCNPCPATIPVLDAAASRTATCVPGTAVLVLAGLKPDEWANWYTDPAATTNLVYSGGTTGPAGNRFEPIVTGPVTYYARVYSDGGLCESTVVLSVDVTIVSPPAAFNVTGGGTVCVGGDGAPVGLDGSESGVEYQLKINGVDIGSPVAGTGSALAFGNKTAAGTYTVTARLLGTNCLVGMTGSAIVVGSQAAAPSMEPGSNGPFCQGAIDFDLILYPGTGQNVIAWQWSGPNGFTSADQQPIIFGPTPANSGIYTLIVTGLNGCTNEATTEYVEIYPQPATQSGCDLALCEETPGSGTATFDLTEREPCLTLEAGGVEVTYYTDAGLNNEIQMPSEFISGSTTVYALITSASHGCTNMAPMQLTVNPLPVVSIAASPGATVCAPATITLSAGQGFHTYLWSPDGQADPAIMPTSTGTYTVEVSTAAGCTGIASRMVTIHAQTPVTCPMNQAVFLNAPAFALAGAAPAGGAYTGMGVSGGTFTPTTAGLGIHTITYAYTDGNGCPGSCTFSITVQSASPPSIVCPPSIVRNADPNQCAAAVTYPPPTFSAEVAPATLTLVSGPASGSAFPKGLTMLNWKVTDGLGREAVCDFTVTVNDSQMPDIVCPASIVRGTDPARCDAAVTYAMPTATDNCPGVTVQRTSAAGTASGSVFPKGTTQVTWEATDAASPVPNKKSCTFTVTVNDVQAPSITCPANLVKGADPNACTAVVTYAEPNVADNCPGVIRSLQSGLPSGGQFPKGMTNVVWRATDGAGLTKTCSFRVTVNDVQVPSITCPASVVKDAVANLCSATATYTTPTFSDNCGGGLVTRILGLASGSAFPVGTNVVVWRAMDASGLSKTCSFTVTVSDAQPPAITCPADIAQDTDLDRCTAEVPYVNPLGTDNCAGAVTFLHVGLASGSVFPLGSSAVVWKVLDLAGLSATCSFTVTVRDRQAPGLTCPPNATLGGGGNPCGLPSASLPSATAMPDNCSNHTLAHDAPATLPAGPTQVTWTATDVAGNATTCAHTVTVTCPTAPGGGTGGLTLKNALAADLGLSVAPNPATALVTFTATGLVGEGELTVFDPLGRAVWQQALTAGQPQAVLELTWPRFAAGVYQVRLRTERGTLSKGLVVSRL